MIPFSNTDDTKSITQLEGNDWGKRPPELPPSKAKLFDLRHKRLVDVTPAELRLLITFGVGLPFVFPRALQILLEQPLIETDYFDGDLLTAVLRTDPAFFNSNPGYTPMILKVAEAAYDAIAQLEPSYRESTRELLDDAMSVFKTHTTEP